MVSVGTERVQLSTEARKKTNVGDQSRQTVTTSQEVFVPPWRYKLMSTARSAVITEQLKVSVVCCEACSHVSVWLWTSCRCVTLNLHGCLLKDEFTKIHWKKSLLAKGPEVFRTTRDLTETFCSNFINSYQRRTETDGTKLEPHDLWMQQN